MGRSIAVCPLDVHMHREVGMEVSENSILILVGLYSGLHTCVLVHTTLACWVWRDKQHFTFVGTNEG